jgi:predicted nucleic acid-binding protein
MLVVDTSVAVKWVVPDDGANVEHGTAEALELLPRGLIAPDCLFGEFANALFNKVRRGEIGMQQARESVSILPSVVDLVPLKDLILPALEISFHLSHPVHDCVFLVLALQTGHPLVTADTVFVERCRRTNGEFPIYLLGENLP